jgi:hypothetical protein
MVSVTAQLFSGLSRDVRSGSSPIIAIVCITSNFMYIWCRKFTYTLERVPFLRGMIAVWSHDVHTWILLVVQMNVVPSGIWKLLPRMNQTCGGLPFFSEVLADLFWFSHGVKQRGTEFEGRSWNIFTGTPPIDSKDVN